MLERLRSRWAAVVTPIARFLLTRGITPDRMTWIGTGLTVIIAVICFPRGWLWQGALLITPAILVDSLDGTMARLGGLSTRWGAFLDSTLDRLADGILFLSLIYWALEVLSRASVVWGIIALILAQLTSYTKARGGALGVEIRSGIITRADRILIVLLAALLQGLGCSWALYSGFIILAIGGAISVIQRIYESYRALSQQEL